MNRDSDSQGVISRVEYPETAPIKKITTTVVNREFRSALAVKGAKTTHARSSFLIICVTLEDGTQGFGEMSGTKNWSGESEASADSLIQRDIRPYLIGKRPGQVLRSASKQLKEITKNNYFTQAAIDMALWDASGKSVSLPVYELLGGKKREKIPIKISISGDGEQIDSGLLAARESGFDYFKVKVGHGYDRDVSRFERVREIVGEDTILGVDANCGWALPEAEKCILALKNLGVAFIEQPVSKHALSEMRYLRSLGVPILADESVYDLEDAKSCIAENASDGISIYVGKSGSLVEALEIGSLCSLTNKDVVIGSNAEFGIGTAAQIHLAATLPELGRFPSDIIGQHFYQEGTLERENLIDGRYAYISDEPGLGVIPKKEIMEALS